MLLSAAREIVIWVVAKYRRLDYLRYSCECMLQQMDVLRPAWPQRSRRAGWLSEASSKTPCLMPFARTDGERSIASSPVFRPVS
jgi:hypothetical protein